MKANELRIGNLVFDEDGTEMYIAGLWPVDNGKRYNFKDSAGNTGNSNILTGIPLTEEWLLKFGFEKSLSNDNEERIIYSIQVANNTSLYFDRHKDWMRGDLEVDWYLSHEWNNNHFKNDFWGSPKYVHQLQNLYFALTGEELICKN